MSVNINPKTANSSVPLVNMLHAQECIGANKCNTNIFLCNLVLVTTLIKYVSTHFLFERLFLSELVHLLLLLL